MSAPVVPLRDDPGGEAPSTKLERLRDLLSSLGAVVVAYSGGADSALLADVAHEVLGDRALAVTAVSPSLAGAELRSARALAMKRGWRHVEIETEELDLPDYRANAPDRCYHCKAELIEAIERRGVRPDGWTLCVGTNADDRVDFRPGQLAADERGARAPLLEAGLSKQEVREFSRERGLPTWDKPASACLASRIAYGIEVTQQRLARVERAEAFFKELGIPEVRVRDHGDLARVEVPPEDVPRLSAEPERSRVVSFLRELGFDYVTLDLEGFRSGSMNRRLLAIGRRSTDGRL